MTHDVLHLLGTGQPQGTGMARIVSALAGNLDSKKYRVHAWFLGDGGPLESVLRSAGALTRVVNWRNGMRDPAGALRFWRELRGTDFAIVHQHFGGRSVRWIVRRALGAKIIVHLHGYVCEARGADLVPTRIGNADAVVAVSDAVARQVTGAHACVVYPGVKVAARTSTAAVDPGFGAEMVIGTACRLVPIKGLQYLLQAVVLLRVEFPGIRLEIAGAGVLQADLERLVSELGLTQSVTFLGWQPDMTAVMSRWDLYVQPSIEEAFGIAALEAMSTGLPVIATSVGGTSELVQDGETGWLVPPRDPMGMARKIGLLLDDEQLRRRMGQAGRVRARDCFSEHRMAAEMSAIYSSLLGHARSVE
jgi:glycosyltransferase involved in cell wall biosynthesis